MVNARSGNIHGVGAACSAVCVDAMGKLMMAFHWSVEAGIMIGEQKANVKDSVRAWWVTFRYADSGAAYD